MTKVLYVLGGMMLVSAGIVGAFCGMERPWGRVGAPGVTELAGIGDLHAGGGESKAAPEAVPPLIAQATAFAQYLKPPEVPVPKTPPQAQAPAPQPIPRPPTVTPKVTLLSTSYYRSFPEKSLALVAEPGKGAYWIGEGDRVGHLVVERITDGTVVYRDGNRLQEVAVPVRSVPPLAQLAKSMPAPVQNVGTVAGPVNPRSNPGMIRTSDVRVTSTDAIE